jgi:hypothetical protein
MRNTDDRFLPAIEHRFVEVSRNGSTSSVVAIYLDIHEQRTLPPSQRLGRTGGGPREVAVTAIEIHPIVRHNSAAVAMEANLDVVPGLRGPGRRIAAYVRAMPVRATAAVIAPLPAMRVNGALRTIDHGFAIGHHLIQIQLQIRHLIWIDHVDICVHNEVRG